LALTWRAGSRAADKQHPVKVGLLFYLPPYFLPFSFIFGILCCYSASITMARRRFFISAFMVVLVAALRGTALARKACRRCIDKPKLDIYKKLMMQKNVTERSPQLSKMPATWPL